MTIIKIFINYICGYMKIKIEGYFIERFINICKSQKIFLWNMKMENSSTMNVNIGIKEFRKLKNIAKKTKCKINIKSKKGIPFILNRYRKRKVFAILLIIVIFTIISMSNFVWNIEIKGNKNINEEDLLKIINQNGLLVGKYKGNIDTKKIVNDIRLNSKDISWIGIDIKGTNAIVEIVEADKKPDIIDENEYCNIVSEKEGIIVKIDSKNGTSLVKQGDVVKNGTILIGGWLEGKYTGVRYVHSNGDIQAKVWYTQREKVDLKQTLREQTGNRENKYILNINNFKINFYKRLSNFKIYDTIYTTKKIKIFSNFYLPVSLTKCNNFEIKEKEVVYDYEKAKEIAQKMAEDKLLDKIKNKDSIKDKKINFYENPDSLEAEVTYEVLENIGTKEKIIF